MPPRMSTNEWNQRIRERGIVSQEKNQNGEWTHFYRDAVDHTGEPLGRHESKKIVMKVVNE
jgi:hypothetical protein